MLVYLVKYVVITASIVAFMAPFLLWYLWQTARERPRTINLLLEEFFTSRQANWLVFSWAAAEAVVWFVIPEFLLLLVIFMRIRHKRHMLLYDVGGTAVGTIAAFIIRLPEHAVAQLPYIQDRMIAQTRVWYDQSGVLGLANQPFSGVPYKVFTHLAWEYQYNFVLFIVVAVVVRMLRYVVAYGLFISLYPKLHKVVERNYLPLAAAAIAIFSVLLLRTVNVYR